MTTSYVWDVASSLPVILQDSIGNTYEYGLGLILQDTNGTPAWSLQDGLGSTVGTTDNSGAITSTYRYDVYGALRGTTGTPGATLTYDGEQSDASGLVYLRARSMDPATGRFVTQDPFANFGGGTQGLDRYTYALDEPVQFSDPYGLWPCPGCGKIKRVARRVSSGVDKAVTSVANGTADLASRFENLDCLDAAIGIAGVAAGFVVGPEAVTLADAILLSVNAGAFAATTGVSLAELHPKEGASFRNVVGGIGIGTSVAAQVLSPLQFAEPYAGLADGSGYLAAGVGAVSCALAVANG